MSVKKLPLFNRKQTLQPFIAVPLIEMKINEKPEIKPITYDPLPMLRYLENSVALLETHQDQDKFDLLWCNKKFYIKSFRFIVTNVDVDLIDFSLSRLSNVTARCDFLKTDFQPFFLG